jgi:hypothetical protein
MGSQGHLRKDAWTLAKWKVDMIKMDGCNSAMLDMPDGFLAFSLFLNETGHPMIYNHEWVGNGEAVPLEIQREFANSWRIGNDVAPSWPSIKSIVDQLGNNPQYAEVAGPGGWNDPDQIVVGCSNGWTPGLNHEESRTQFGIWSLVAAPLMMSNDLRHIHGWQKDILQNAEVIAIDQDPMGKPGKRLTYGNQQVWARPLSNGDWGIGLLNAADSPADIEFNFSLVGSFETAYLRDLWAKKDLGGFTNKYVAHDVGPHDTVMLRLKPVHT